MLHRFANGQDRSGVRRYYAVPPMKSIGNSTTAPRDLVSGDDVKITLMALSESVGARLREQGGVCSTITVSIRDNRLLSCDRQMKPPQSTANTLDIGEAALELSRRHHTGGAPVRSLAIKAGGLSPASEMEQLSLFPEEQKDQRRTAIDRTLDNGFTILGKSFFNALTAFHFSLDMMAASLVYGNHCGGIPVSLLYPPSDFQ